MKKTKFGILVLVVLAAIGSSCFGQGNITARIDSLMRTANDRGIFNGNILVARKGKIIYSSALGYAQADKSKKLDREMIFDIGSISKEFNGVAIMILKDRKLLSIEDPISKFLPELPDWATKVKIRHLISYTSGIPIFDALATETDSVIQKNLLSLKTLKFEPGTAYIYNHYNVYLQMRIIEQVSGLKYADFIKKNILEPLKMKHSFVDYPTSAERMAKAFDSEMRPVNYTQGMSGWVRLNITDLYKWTAALDSYKIISAESYRELAVNFAGGESSLGSTGFEGEQLLWHQHQGSNSNYEALLYHNLKDALTIVMMTNNQQMKVHGLKSAIIAIVKNEAFTIPKKSVYLEVREKMLNDIDKGIAYYKNLKAQQQESYDFSFEIGDLISTGKYLQRRARYDDAIRIFAMAVELDAIPADVSYGYELMAETYLKKGNKTDAITWYQKAISIDSNNKNAKGMIATLSKN